MFTRRFPWRILLVGVLWVRGFRIIDLFLELAGSPLWSRWVMYISGIVLVIGWLVWWLYRTAAPLAERAARGRREHPGAVVFVVSLDEEWNPVDSPTLTVLAADAEQLVLDGVMRVPAADVVDVSVTFASPRRRALAITLSDTTWTAVVIREQLGGAAGGRATERAAERIREALGLEVLDHVLDRRDELPHV